jgi:hypothetical protein
MKASDYLDAAEFVAAWRRAGPVLDAVRAREIRDADTARFILETTDLFDAVIARSTPRESSGLVEQQRLFSQLAR